MINITVKDIIEAVKDIAEENPDYHYKRDDDTGKCAYLHWNVDANKFEPGCLVGHALVKLGVPLGDIFPLNNEGASELISKLEIDGSHNDIYWLCAVQDRQDQGDSWGKAIAIENDEF